MNLNTLLKRKNDILVIIISLLVLIIGTKLIGFILPFIMVLMFGILYFVPEVRKRLKIFIRNLIKKISKKTPPPAHAKGKSSLKNQQKKVVKGKNNYKEDKIKKINSAKKKKSNQKKNKKIWKIIFIIIISGIILGILAIVLFFIFIVTNAPDFDPNELYVSEPSVLYDKDGNEITKLGSEKRIILEYDELPEVLIDAIVATEDSKFFSHKGVDWARFIKASTLQLLGNSNAGGASTLTMQVSKNTYTSSEASGIKGIIRKFTDVYISEFKIEPNYSKEEIMEFYVNSYYLGNNAYGVEQASLTYFGKSAKDLNVAEAAMIAGLFQAPSTYNPYTNPEATEVRRGTVLKLMKRHGYINDKEYKIAKEMEVSKIVKEKDAASDPTISEFQSFVDVVVAEVEEKTGDDPYTVAMNIYTTMDRDKQTYVNGIMNGDSYNWENEVVQAGVAVTDIKTGAIVAVGGGRNIDAAATLNRATQIKRQIGSTAKPLYDYGPAVEYLNWSTGMPLVDEPITYSDGTSINNWDGAFEGYETMRTALTRSRNIPALKAFQANSKSNIIDFVKKLGLHPEDPLHEAHAIGGYTGESPLNMAAAYAAFGNGGYYNKPYSYTKIEYTLEDKEVENEVKAENENNNEPVMKDSTAYMISNMLVDTAKYALGGYSNINGLPYAAKTGTTNYDTKTLAALGLTNTTAVNDLWCVGFNTEYAIGVWYGYDKNSSEYYNRVNTAQHTRLFQAVGRGIFTSTNTFTRPGSVSEVTIETENPQMMLPSEFTPDSLKKTELFVKGHEPVETSMRFAKLENTSSVKATANNGKITITWSGVKTPEINTQNYLTKYFKDTFRNTNTLSSFVNGRLNYINSTLGSFGYQIYRQDDNGNLTRLGFTNDTTYTTNVSSNGKYTFIVKTSYSNFTSNASDGKSATVTVSGVSSNEKDEENKKDNDHTSVNPSCSEYGDDYTLSNGVCIDSNGNEEDACPTGYKYDKSTSKCALK